MDDMIILSYAGGYMEARIITDGVHTTVETRCMPVENDEPVPKWQSVNMGFATPVEALLWLAKEELGWAK